MPTTHSLRFINKVDELEAEEVFQLLACSLMFDTSKNTKTDLHEKSVFISFFSRALEEVIQNNVVKSKRDRLKIIKFLDKLKQQKEAIEFAKVNDDNLQIASERLGRKAQSAFGSSSKK